MDEKLVIEIQAEIGKLKTELDKAKGEIEKFGNSSQKKLGDFNSAMQTVGTAANKGLKVAATALAGAATALLGVSAATQDYRKEQAKLMSAFETAGASAETAKQTYNDLYRVLGEDDTAVEAANHLAQMTTSQKELSEWTNICQGVYATFGASLPIEGLTEAANETAKVGQVTGSLADALNWAGISEDDFNKKLEKCNTEAEREKLIRETLNGMYSEAAANYEETAASTLAQNEAQASLNENMAKLGEAVAPVVTALTDMATIILDELSPAIQSFMDNQGDELEKTLTKIGEAIATVIGFIVDNIALIGTIAGVIMAIVVAINLYNAAMAIYNIVMAPVNAIILAIVAAIVALIAVITLIIVYWDEIKAGAIKCWEGIKKAFSNAGKWFSDIFEKAWQGIKNAFSKVTGFFSGIWEKIKSIFSNVGSAIAGAITNTVKSAINGILSTAVKIINGFISAINIAIGIINAIPGVSIKKLSKLDVPKLAEGGVVDKATLAVIGERGKEMVMPLENNLEYLDKLADMLATRMGGVGSSKVVLQVDKKVFGEVSIDSINAITKQRGALALNIV